MKGLLFILPLLCLSAWGQQSEVGGNAVGSTGAILGLTNVPYYVITTPTTNFTFNRTNFYFTNLTTAKDAANTTVTISALNGQYWIYQSAPLVLTNTTGGFLVYTNDGTVMGDSAPSLIAYTNIDISVNGWIAMYPVITNGDALTASVWLDGQGTGLPDNSGNFKTNTVITYPRTDLVINRQTNVVIRTAAGSVNITNYPSPSAEVVELVTGTKAGRLVFSTVAGGSGDPGDGVSYGGITIVPDHGGSSSVANSEMQIIGERLALVWQNVLQIGIEQGFASSRYAQMHSDSSVSANTSTNHSMPLFFLTKSWNGVSYTSHFPGIYAKTTVTNGLPARGGTGYLGLGYRQNVNFENEDGTGPSFVSTNDAIRVWFGGSNTVEIVNNAVFDNTVSLQTNIAAFQFTPSNPGNFLTGLGQRDANTAQRATLELDLGFVDAATGTPAAKVVIEQGLQITNTWICSAPGTIVSTITNHYSFKLTTNAVVTVTDISRGSGASVTIANSQLTSE